MDKLYNIEIPLYNKKKEFIANAIISNENYKVVSQYTLYAQVCKHTTYVGASKNGKCIQLHHLIVGKSDDENLVVDHINHNGLDNTRENLRIVTRNVNSHNRKKQKNTTSRYIGVCYHKRHRKWVVAIDLQGEKFNLGSFDSEIEAAKCYDKAVLQVYKNNANTNNVLSKAEIYTAINTDFKKETKKRDLPKYISLSYGKYRVRMVVDKEKIQVGNIDTLDEAKSIVKKFLIHKGDIEAKKTQLMMSLPITRCAKGIAIIMIKQQYNFYVAYVDDDMWHKINMLSWNLATNDYAQTKINGKVIKMHTIIYKHRFNKVGSIKNPIDHINNNGLDNRISNLRIVSSSHNGQNKESKINSSSKYKGVVKRKDKWSARISKNRKCYELGFFIKEVDAARAYNEKAIELYGQGAKLNSLK